MHSHLKAQAQHSHIPIITSIVITLAAGSAFSLAAPVLSLNLEHMTEGSGPAIGWLAALGAFSTLFATPFLPGLMKICRGRFLLALALLCGGLCFLAYKIFPSVPVWYGIRFVQGLTLTVVFVLCETWINQRVSGRHRGKILGLYAMVLGSGMVAGGLLARLTGIEGWPPFLTGFALCLVPLMMLVLPGPDVEPPSSSRRGFYHMVSMIGRAPRIMAAAFAAGAVEIAMFYFLPVYATRLGFDEKTAVLLLAFGAAGSIVLQIPLGVAADHLNRVRLSLLAGFVCVLAPLGAAFTGGQLWALYPLIFLYFGAAGGLYTLGLIRLGECFKGQDTGAANSGFVLLYGLGTFVAAPFLGAVIELPHPQALMFASAFLSALYCGFVLWPRRGQIRKV